MRLLLQDRLDRLMSAYGIETTPVVGGERDLRVGGADELAGERRAAVARARACARARGGRGSGGSGRAWSAGARGPGEETSSA